MLLNKTTGRQVRRVTSELFEKYPTPQLLIDANQEELAELIKPLGLWRKRTLSLIAFTREFITKPWKYPLELHGIGKYANDAYRMFCLGEWKDLKPEDKELKRYLSWLKSFTPLGLSLSP